MKNISQIWKVVPAFALGAILAGCGGGATDTSPAENSADNSAQPTEEKLSTVTVGYTPTIVLPQPLVGTEEGQYEKLIPGVKFEKKLFNAGSGVVEQLRAGTIQIGFSGPYPAIKAFAKAGDVVLLANAANGGTEISVLKNSPIKSVKDLKGKKIGVNQPGSTVDAFVRNQLIKAGLKPDTDVKILEVAPGDQAEYLTSGQVDAVAAPAPWPSQVQLTANARPLVNWKDILAGGEYSSGAAYTTKTFADAHPEFIKQFLSAHKQITDDLNKDRTKADARVLAAWSKVSQKTLKPEVAKAAFATIKFTDAPDGKDLQNQADIALATGGLKKQVDLAGFIYEVK
jgi:NitT/TauT family transport system substrate-binding protein